MSTLQQIREELVLLLDNTDEFTSSELNGFINESIKFFTTQAKYPVDVAEVELEAGKDVYNLPSDFQMLINAFMGDKTLNGDIRRLKQYPEPVLSNLHPSWLQTNSDNWDRPTSITLINRKQFLLYPPPSATYSGTNKKVYLDYVYYPANLSSDSETPDLPESYHSHLKLYAANLAYLGKLKNPEMATKLLNECMAKIKLIEPPSIKEYEELGFSFTDVDDLSTGETSIRVE